MDNPKYDEQTIVNELEKIRIAVKKIETRYSKLSGKSVKNNRKEYENIYQDMMTILVYLGKLSSSENIDEVREMYEVAARTEYPKSPKKAINLFLKNYTKHTERFDVIKEKCWKIVDKTAPIVYNEEGVN